MLAARNREPEAQSIGGRSGTGGHEQGVGAPKVAGNVAEVIRAGATPPTFTGGTHGSEEEGSTKEARE